MGRGGWKRGREEVCVGRGERGVGREGERRCVCVCGERGLEERESATDTGNIQYKTMKVFIPLRSFSE